MGCEPCNRHAGRLVVPYRGKAALSESPTMRPESLGQVAPMYSPLATARFELSTSRTSRPTAISLSSRNHPRDLRVGYESS
jgi:hypothetical protein